MFKSFLALLVLCSIANCVPIDQIDLPRAVSDFAFDLYEHVAKWKSGNVIISPLSVATSLALLSQAAEGRTYTELRNGLHFNHTDKATVANQYHRFTEILERDMGSAQLNLANKIYVQQGHRLNRNFRNVATTKFRSGVETLNFGDSMKSAEIINHFVAEKTHGQIRQLVSSDSLSSDMVVYLVNAIYFKGNWAYPFNKQSTRKAPFHTSSKQQIWTDFMYLNHRLNYTDSKELQASLVELKYADSKLSFVVALPHQSSNIDELAWKIKRTKLVNIVKQMRPHEIQLSMPKFKVEYKIKLNDVLKQMHMGTMLTDNANLRGILDENDTKNLVITDVVHKAVIEIDEQGSIASGSTGVGIAPSSIMKFDINYPFLYYIRDTETGTILFNGRYETVERH